MFIPANHSRAKCTPCSTSPPAAGISGPPQRAPCSVPWHQPGSCSVVSLRGQELFHSANSRGLRNSGCASGFDYVWTSSFTIDNCHSLEMFLPSCALGEKKKKRKKINKLFLWFVLVAAGILGVLKQGTQDTIGKRTDQLSGTGWPFRPLEPPQKPCQLQTSCGIRNSFWRHCWKVLIR